MCKWPQNSNKIAATSSPERPFCSSSPTSSAIKCLYSVVVLVGQIFLLLLLLSSKWPNEIILIHTERHSHNSFALRNSRPLIYGQVLNVLSPPINLIKDTHKSSQWVVVVLLGRGWFYCTAVAVAGRPVRVSSQDQEEQKPHWESQLST